MKTAMGWLLAGLGALVGPSGCARDAFAVVELRGAEDAQIQYLTLAATLDGNQAFEFYPGHPQEVSFFLPEGSLGETLEVTIKAWNQACVVATGTASGPVENRPRLTLSVEFPPLTSCP